MRLGFADELGTKDGKRYAVIWMDIDSVEDAKSCHSSVRILPLVEYDPEDYVVYPNRYYRIHGKKDRSADKKAKWYRIEGESVQI